MAKIEIDLDRVLDTALWGVRRASIFMGLGLNAALDPDFKSYQLTKVSALRFAPDEVADATLAHFKEWFGHWIVNNALRELMEPFSQFLDHVYRACLHLAVEKKDVQPEEANRLDGRFIKRGIDGKLDELDSRFAVRADHPAELSSLHFERNCIAHRSARVSQKDCGSTATLAVRWIGFQFAVLTPKGEHILLASPMSAPVYLPDGGDLTVTVVQRSLEFRPGEVIKIPPTFAAEICYFVASEARSVARSALEFAQRRGARVEIHGAPGEDGTATGKPTRPAGTSASAANPNNGVQAHAQKDARG